MRHSPGELLEIRKSNRGEQKSIPILILGFPMKYSEIRANFRCARGVEYDLGCKDDASIGFRSGTMKFDKIRAVEEQIETLVDGDMT